MAVGYSHILTFTLALAAPLGTSVQVFGQTTPSKTQSHDPLANLTLSYEAPSGCGSAGSVRRALRSTLGDEEVTSPQRIDARIHVTKEGTAYRLRYSATTSQGTSSRTMVVDSCNTAQEAAALLLLLSLDPALADTLGASSVLQAQTQETSPQQVQTPEDQTPENQDQEAANPQPPAGETSAPRPSEPAKETAPPEAKDANRELDAQAKQPSSSTEQAERKTTRVRISKRQRRRKSADGKRQPLHPHAWAAVGPELVSGMAANTSLGGALQLGLGVGRFAVSVGGGWLGAFRSDIGAVQGAEVSSTLRRGYIHGQARFGTKRLGVWPFLGAGVERVDAATQGVSTEGEGHTQWPSALAGAALKYSISKAWRVGAEASAVVPLQRPKFLIAGVDTPAHRPDAIGGRLFLGVFWHWGSQF